MRRSCGRRRRRRSCLCVGISSKGTRRKNRWCSPLPRNAQGSARPGHRGETAARAGAQRPPRRRSSGQGCICRGAPPPRPRSGRKSLPRSRRGRWRSRLWVGISWEGTSRKHRWCSPLPGDARGSAPGERRIGAHKCGRSGEGETAAQAARAGAQGSPFRRRRSSDRGCICRGAPPANGPL